MAALAAVAEPEVENPEPSPLARVAISLADEGIPVRAIARATRISSSEVYEILREAILTGELLEMPKDDWPVGSNRAQRFALVGTILENDDALQLAVGRCFRATRLEAVILAVLIKRTEVTKKQLHLVIEQSRPSENREPTDPKMVDVMIHHVRRKLRPHGLELKTVWGLGYRLPVPDRDKAIEMLLNNVSTEEFKCQTQSSTKITSVPCSVPRLIPA